MGNTTWIWIVGLVIVAVLIGSGTINLGFLQGTTPTPAKTTIYPSTLQTTLTLNTKDALSSSDINANVSFYVFDKAGNFVTSGTTAAGTASVVLNYLGDYNLLAFSDATWYPVEQTFSIASGEASKTLNLALNGVSGALIKVVRNPVTLNSNLSVGVGQTVSFDVLYQANSSAKAVYKPVVVVDANQTSVQDLTLGGLSKVTCPQRFSVSSGRKLFCFQDTTILASEGIRTLKGSVVFSQSIAPATLDLLNVNVLDTQAWTDSNFAGKGRVAFHEGAENLNTNANVGAADSITQHIDFTG
jgi:hypothetical protein